MKTIKYSDLEQSEIIHTFEYYDFPLFFISKSPYGELFLNYYIEEIEENVDKWLFSKITNKERKDLIEQRLSVSNLLNRLLKKQRLYHLYVDSNLNQPNEEVNIELVNSSNFDPESFPEEDFFVEFDYVTKRNLVRIEHDLIDSSRFKIVLKDPNNSHDIGLDLFIEVLSNLKKSINDIANDIGSKLIGEKSSYPINLRVDSFQPSSFGVWLRTEPLEADLFEVPEKSLNNLFELIDDIEHKNPSEIEEQIEIDEEYSLETIKSVKKLLKDIKENEFSIKLEATTKSDKLHKQVKFDKDSYNKLDILTNILRKKNEKYTEKIELEGLLTSVNTINNNFRISTGNGEIGGRMSKDLFKRLKNDQNIKFRVPSLIKATIEKEIINDYVEDEHSQKFILVHFEQPE
ncbi:DUF6575 domain-containing protein [Neobacillus ginsengisoli]|uniref:DUF6575 domain-containing protein n=1 Tax=Neobacillus ginsengisoli TaxID=904295 RepID=A0ABT9Y375_9BACI|nr:DUF6575 domain-containing protein [Neobacillus ginsengisoli]MDQ0202181.1 hypothetical protein [Neobacillus ginsengisoli]